MLGNAIEQALKLTTDTKACVIGAGAVEAVAKMFRDLFPTATRAIVISDPRTRQVSGARVCELLAASGIQVLEHVLCANGAWFHAEYKWVDEVRTAIAASSGAVPVAVGSGTINDTVKRSAEELGVRYLVVGTAASMDGYTSYGASITKDGIKQTMSCKAPLGCIVDSAVAAAAPKEMVASGFADLIAKVPAGADWILADAIGSEAIQADAWRFVQDPLRDSLKNPLACAAGDVGETEKLCAGLVMSGFAMQAMGSSRPASGSEHQFSHYWDMEDLSFNGRPVSHGFKVGIGTLASTATLKFLLEQDLTMLDVDGTVSKWWPTFEALKATFPRVYGNRPAHVVRAEQEMSAKYVSPETLRKELSFLRANWRDLAAKMTAQMMPFEEVREALRAVGAPFEPEMIGVSRERLRETFVGVPYMRSRYFALDLVLQLGLLPTLLNRLFGSGGIWEIAG